MQLEIFKVKDKQPPNDKYVIRWTISEGEIIRCDFLTVEDDDGVSYWSDNRKVYSDDYWSNDKI